MSARLIHESDVRRSGVARPVYEVAGERGNGSTPSTCRCASSVWLRARRCRPAHAHPNGEELIYIIRGTGRVVVDGEVDPVREGTAVLFPQGSVHMLQNTGGEEMKVICFFAPAVEPVQLQVLRDIDFPE